MSLMKTVKGRVMRLIIRIITWYYRLQFQIVYLLRRYVYPKDPEDVKHIIAKDKEPTELQKIFLSNGLVKGDYASYYYYGEDMNMVKGIYKDDEYEWYQYHIRGFKINEGTRLRPHVELYWRVYPSKHIQEKNLSVKEGIETTMDILDKADDVIDYHVVEDDTE